ncbi:hypothetical protein SAMN05216389_102257 [Oceanobacillus limi]|uniref:ABC transporter periplasmic binding protein yphF n=1 Tax=Oceanobacillus limi TaxID=930131 RepID=A0A1H9ZGD8_9BACI|nr:hypothetical protein [Oceanobacillus limi]SES80733.1 hypothetical protein SAMN05216389_102257 [Oceanobacillus limi]
MKRTYKHVGILLLLLSLLSGCLYPDDQRKENQQPNEVQLESVQNAVEQYQERTNGLLPIKTKSSDTPIFEKYLIDFSAMKEENVLTELPGNSFENGGVYQYTLIYPEDDPQVKLIDLRVTEELRKANVHLDGYRNKHIYPPFGEEIAEGLFTIDYQTLGFDEPLSIISPYSNEHLPIIMDTDGKLYIDYRIDLQKALGDFDHVFEEGDDIRYLIAENTPFVPVYSLPYTIKDGEPVFMNGQ